MNRRIFISHTKDSVLNQKQLKFKNTLIQEIKDEGYIPEIFSISGSARRLSWSFDNVEKVMKNCCGAIIIAFPRWSFDNNSINMPSEYSHYEGAIALKNKLPTLIITEDSSMRRGITDPGAGQPITFIDENATGDFIDDDRFKRNYSFWLDDINKRYDVFLGYCSKAKNTATSVQLFLQSEM